MRRACPIVFHVCSRRSLGLLMTVPLWSVLLIAQALTPEVIEHTQAGVEAQKQGHLDIAIAEFQKAVALAPEVASGHANLGNAYFQKGSYEQAISELERAVQLSPELLGAHQALGVALLVRGDAARALPHLEKTRNPALLGLAYLELGQLTNAIDALQVALTQDRHNPDLLYYFGQATALASRKAFDEIGALDPTSARAHQVMADRNAEQGRLSEAAREYLSALQIKPYTPGVHLALGRVLADIGDWPNAIVEFRAEAKIRPASAEAFYELGSALLHQGQPRDAVAELAHADELSPNTPLTLLALGKAALGAGDQTRALKSWTKILEIQHDGQLAAQAHFELAAAYRQTGRTEDSDREMKEYERLGNKPQK